MYEEFWNLVRENISRRIGRKCALLSVDNEQQHYNKILCVSMKPMVGRMV